MLLKIVLVIEIRGARAGRASAKLLLLNADCYPGGMHVVGTQGYVCVTCRCMCQIIAKTANAHERTWPFLGCSTSTTTLRTLQTQRLTKPKTSQCPQQATTCGRVRTMTCSVDTFQQKSVEGARHCRDPQSRLASLRRPTAVSSWAGCGICGWPWGWQLCPRVVVHLIWLRLRRLRLRGRGW